MNDFIERLRAKPEHVRKSIALGTAGSVTGLVALVWAVSFSSSGTFAFTPDPVGERTVSSAFAEASGPSLLGAVGALISKEEGEVEVVGTRASSTVSAPRPEERTVIPF